MFEYTIVKKITYHNEHLDLDQVHSQQTFSKIDVNDLENSEMKVDLYKLENKDWDEVKKNGTILRSFTVITTIEVEYIPD